MAKLKIPLDLIQDACQCFRLLGDQNRLRIVLLLSDSPRNVGELCKELKLPQPTVSHHLGLLRMSRMIVGRRNGKQVIYSVNTTALEDLGRRFIKATAGRGKNLALGAFTVSAKP